MVYPNRMFLGFFLMVLLSGFGIADAAASWTRQLGSKSCDLARGVAVDGSGNVYVAGHTQGALDGNTYLGGWDVFLVKYDPSGNKQWTRQMGTPGDDAAYGAAVDGSGDVYVAGYTTAGFDGNTNAGGSDAFVAKFDPSGNTQWTKQFGSAYDDVAYGVAVDGTGNVYVTGYTWDGLDGNVCAGVFDFFLVKYSSSGVKQWTVQGGTEAEDEATGVAVGANGEVYVAGWTKGGLYGNANTGSSDIFLVKYDADGGKQWTVQTGSFDDDEAYGVAVDGSGCAYVAGYTKGGFGVEMSAGGEDAILMKFDPSGNVLWTKQTGTIADDVARGVAVDASGNVYVDGETAGSLDGAANAGLNDVFQVKYDSDGNKQSAYQMGTPADDHAASIAVGLSGYLYVTGYTRGVLDGDINEGGNDLFVMKLANPPSSVSFTPSSSYASTGTKVTFTASASGGSGPYEYKFYHYGPETGYAWAAQSSYAASDTWDWTPSSSDVGNNWFYVVARNTGSEAEWEAWVGCSVTVKTPPAAVSLAKLPSKPVYFAGRPVTIRATASGGTGPYEYLFWLVGPGTGNTWLSKQAYSTTATWYWTASSSDVGTNYVVVYVKNAGSPSVYEAYAVTLVTVIK